MKKISAVLCALALCSCTSSSSVSWHKPGASAQDQIKDSYECEKDMRQSGYFGHGIVAIIEARNFQDKCMVSKGYLPSKEE